MVLVALVVSVRSVDVVGAKVLVVAVVGSVGSYVEVCDTAVVLETEEQVELLQSAMQPPVVGQKPAVPQLITSPAPPQ